MLHGNYRRHALDYELYNKRNVHSFIRSLYVSKSACQLFAHSADFIRYVVDF